MDLWTTFCWAYVKNLELFPLTDVRPQPETVIVEPGSGSFTPDISMGLAFISEIILWLFDL
jgi:hypothetical protein